MITLRRFCASYVLGSAVFIVLVGCSESLKTTESIRLGVPSISIIGVNDILSIAERDYMSFLQRIPVGQETAYGFRDRAEFDAVRLGMPLRVHTVDVDRTGNAPTVGAVIRALDEWRVPLEVAGERRALLTIVKQSRGLAAVDFGASGLADAIDKLDKAAPKDRSNPAYLLRIFDLRQDYFAVVSSADGERFYPASPLTHSALLGVTSISPPPVVPASEQFLQRDALFDWIQAHVKGGPR